MFLDANDRRVLKRFLVHLLRDRPSIHLVDGRVVERGATFRAEPREARRKRLRVLRESRKQGLLSNEDQQIRDGLEGSSVYSSGYASVYRRKPAGKRAPNIQETKRLYVAKLVYEKLCPEKNPYEFLESETCYESAAPRALEMRLRGFEKECIAAGQITCFQVVESLFRMFKASEVARRHAELYQGFPGLGIPPANIGRLTELMRVTESEIQLLQSLCQGRGKSLAL